MLATALVLALCGFAIAGPAFAQAPAARYPISGTPAPNYSQAPNLDFIKKQLLYYRCRQYDANVASVLAEARKWGQVGRA